MYDWIVQCAGELWVSGCGMFNAVRVGPDDWRLTEVVRLPAACGVRLVVMEHDRRFSNPNGVVMHVRRLLGQRAREAVPERADGIIGRGNKGKGAA